MADTSLGFRFDHCQSGNTPNIQKLVFKDSETLTKGDLVNLESGEVDLAATADTALLGMVLQTLTGTDSATEIEVITSQDAVYRVYDANARAIGDTLDIAGATGLMTVAASSNADLVVVANSTSSEETLVKIAHDSHALNA
ncbi:MAG: hypothetical protein ACPG7F_00725 [Aggregatilineales bacterium]